MIPIFKIHCSQISKIMGGSMGKPTEKQLSRIAELEAKQAVKPLTTTQAAELAELVGKRDAKPALQEGAKTYCKQWLKEQADLYNRRKHFGNSKTEKGLTCENDGIKMTARIMGYGEVFKNEKFYHNDYIAGTPDLILAKIIEDIKCSWDEQTFPLFETELPNKDYWWQGQGYLAIVGGRDRFAVSYCLIDTPTDLIDKAAFYRAKDLGMDEVSMELYDEVAAQMTYPNVPDYLKYRRFEFDRDDAAIQAVYKQVELCREYINNELLPQIELLKPVQKQAA